MDPVIAFSFGSLLNILYVAIGLTFVIIFHELGHFAVAKWCDVQVERFSIGFGPVLLRFKKGETEYALSAIPFGGYVKMLGQDDTDPSQMSAEEIAQDPRSYSAKSVAQRMSIISAGVIMNVATGLLFFACGFALGVEEPDAVIGHVEIGLPAWKAGIEPGDHVTSINGREVEVFSDISRAVALSSTDSLTIEGEHVDGTPFEVTLESDSNSTRPQIGVSESLDLALARFKDKTVAPTVPGTAAAAADPPFAQGDRILKVDGQEISSFPILQEVLAEKRDKTVRFLVERKAETEEESENAETETLEIVVQPRQFRTLGLSMGIGPITAVKEESPAHHVGLREGDVISRVNGEEVGTQLNPLRLPDYFADRHDEEVEIVVRRPEKGGEPREVALTITPLNKQGWIEKPLEGQPVSVPAIGIAFQLTSTVLGIEPGSAVEGKVKVEERIQKMELILPKGAKPDGYTPEPIVIRFDEKDDNKELIHNWAYAFWRMQSIPTRKVRLHVLSPGQGDTGKEKVIELEPQPVEDWYLPTRGIMMTPLMRERKAEGVADALGMGWMHTKNNVTDIYLTLRSLFGGRISVKELHGPIGIATVAYHVASSGFARLLVFLGFLSVNLAVINFLPIPVLDGGHMVFLIWEAVTRKKPSERVLIAATYAGMAVVLGLMVLVLYLDIFVHWLPGM